MILITGGITIKLIIADSESRDLVRIENHGPNALYLTSNPETEMCLPPGNEIMFNQRVTVYGITRAGDTAHVRSSLVRTDFPKERVLNDRIRL
jgi:hypothetical protein